MEIDRDYFIGEHVIPSAVGFLILAVTTLLGVWLFSLNWLEWYRKILLVYYVLFGYRVCAKLMRDIFRAGRLSSQRAWLYRWATVLLPGFFLWGIFHIRAVRNFRRAVHMKRATGNSAGVPLVYVTVDGQIHAVAYPGSDMPPMEVDDALLLVCGLERTGSIFVNGNVAYIGNRLSSGDQIVLERTPAAHWEAPQPAARPEDSRFPPLA